MNEIGKRGEKKLQGNLPGEGVAAGGLGDGQVGPTFPARVRQCKITRGPNDLSLLAFPASCAAASRTARSIKGLQSGIRYTNMMPMRRLLVGDRCRRSGGGVKGVRGGKIETMDERDMFAARD